jgi:dihydrofolate reductase
MRKLKLQMQLSIDGFVAGPKGELDWMVWEWDQGLKNRVTEITEAIDTILLGRKMADGFINHWTSVVEKGTTDIEDNVEFESARKFVETPKIIFSRTLAETTHAHTRVENNLPATVVRLKEGSGGDIIAYGGADFVSSLIREDLIDEYHLFLNPLAIGKGMRIFHEDTKLTLVDSTPYECGIVVNQYARAT